jgi:glycosyltransferase involved in cell wall biosynthesis
MNDIFDKYNISVIIPMYNQKDMIEDCLKAILNQSYAPYEVIVVDGHSNDGSTQKAEKYPIKLIYENYSINTRSRSGACQVGVEHANGDYIAITDADCIPDKDWLLYLTKVLNDKVKGIGGKVINKGNNYWEDSINIALSSILGSAGSLQTKPLKKQKYVKSISGSNSLYKKEDVIKVGGFNPQLQGAEDLDLNIRLLRLGPLLYTPKAIVNHYHNWGSEGKGGKILRFAKKMYRYGRDRGLIRSFGYQFVPLIIFLMLIISSLYNMFILPLFVIFYLIVILTFSIKLAIQRHKFKSTLQFAIIFMVEHVAYSLGLFYGILQSVLKETQIRGEK